MSDMDPLYESMKDSAEDMSKAAVEMKGMMTGDINADVNIEGYGPKPSFSKQIKSLFAGKSEGVFRLYPTLAAAQADIANTPVGSTTYYRSPDDSALAIEVINNSGTLEPTGRKMPSWDRVLSVLESIQRLFTALSITNNSLNILSDSVFTYSQSTDPIIENFDKRSSEFYTGIAILSNAIQNV
ncbi:TPA: hypothetical protein MCR44_003742, partial [Klebsiella pneumoniae]|nr:hypothetical protein [Klebsiella pneumoniae]